jgi:hypothetical protein
MTDCPTYQIQIFIAGDVSAIRAVCRSFCERGFCVTITPTEYVFTGGCENGAIIGIINYARFPRPSNELDAVAFELASCLMDKCSQRSCTVQTPTDSHWLQNPAITIPR